MTRVRLYTDGGYGLALREGYTFPVDVEGVPYYPPCSRELLGYDIGVAGLCRVFHGVAPGVSTLYFSLVAEECKEVVRCEPSR